MKRLQGHVQETASDSGAVSCDLSWPLMSAFCLQKYLIMDTADVQVTLYEMLGQYWTYSQALAEILLVLFTAMLL